MKLLYGSQNFGYNLVNSDKDWLEFVYPTWEQIIKGDLISKERQNEDGSITKVKDIRLIAKMIKKSNFNDLQFLFSIEMEDCCDLNWFFINRDKLIRYNMWQLYVSNTGYIKSQLKENTPKSIVRAYAFAYYISEVLNDKEFKLYNSHFSILRKSINEKNKDKLKDIIINKISKLESKYIPYKGIKDEVIEKEMYKYIEELLVKNLYKF